VTGGDSGSKLVMKGSSVRVRASALKDLQNAHCCFLSRRRIMCSNAAAFAIRGCFERFWPTGRQNTGPTVEAEHRVGRPSEWCSRLALRSRPASEHGSAAIRSVAATAGDLWTSVQRSGVRHRDDEPPAFGQEQSSGELQPTRLLLVHSTHAVGAAAGSCSRRRSRCRALGMRADEGRPRGVGTCSPPTRSLWRDSTSRLGAPVGVNSPTL
jgi:hypothetical protein